MDDAGEQWRLWVQALVGGVPEGAEEFWRLYGARLQGLAAHHVSAGLQRREGPEDIVQSVCRTFLRRARSGQFSLEEEGALWRLLCAITLTKIREKERFHRRQKRGFDRERPLGSADDPAAEAAPAPAGAELNPADAAEFAEQVQRLLADLDEEQRGVVQLKLQGYTNEEAAQRLHCSERTVRRMLKSVRVRWSAVLEESQDE